MYSDGVIVEARGLSKCYQIYDQPVDRLKQFLWRGRRKFYRDFWALNNISFRVKKGECFGIIGRNGSGKSTLLQILAGTLHPTHGSFAINGRVSALLELGAGFNMEFTGRENVYLNAAILGIKKDDVDGIFPLIEEFAEIGQFMNQPVKTYSSGMYVRLAFAVAIHVSPDVLIVDEALAVGDTAFQYKCMRRLEKLLERGVSILFVTHDLGAVKRLCGSAVWLHEGQLKETGGAVEVADHYEDYMRCQIKESLVVEKEERAEESGAGSAGRKDPRTAGSAPHAKIIRVETVDENGSSASTFPSGSMLKLNIFYEVFIPPPEGLVVGAAVFRSDDLYVCGVNSYLDRQEIPSGKGEQCVTICYDELKLLPGSYYFKVGVFDHHAHVIWDFDHLACKFTVTSTYLAEGVVLLAHRWENC